MTTDTNENKQAGMKSSVIQTTVGDLIYAIAEAAEEAKVEDIEEYTSLVLDHILRTSA